MDGMEWIDLAQNRDQWRWVNNIKMDLRAIEWGGMDWIGLAQWRAVLKTVISLRVP
jgi:hypothetical protein